LGTAELRTGNDGAPPDGGFPMGPSLRAQWECHPFRLNLSAKSFPPVSHHRGVTGWTSRLRRFSSFQLLTCLWNGSLRPFLSSQAECRRFEPDIPLRKSQVIATVCGFSAVRWSRGETGFPTTSVFGGREPQEIAVAGERDDLAERGFHFDLGLRRSGASPGRSLSFRARGAGRCP
jgi:hypothetical protein